MNPDWRSRPRCDKYYTRAELRAMLELARASDDLHHLFLLTVYVFGLRVSEALALRAGDVSSESVAIRTSKRGQAVRVPLFSYPEDPLFNVSYWLQGHARRLHPVTQLFPWGRQHAHALVCHYATLAGVPRERQGVHALRHSAARHAKDAGCGIATVQQLLRHKSIASTGAYFKESMAEAMAKVHAGLRQAVV